jgi:hypothetical protein
MQEELFRLLSTAYKKHLNATIQALDITRDPAADSIVDAPAGVDVTPERPGPFEVLTRLSLETREEQLAFLARHEDAERNFEKLNLDRTRLGHIREDGFRVAQEKRAKTENPYMPVTIEHIFWYRGWCQGMNVFPITEIPMRDVFELDRPVTRFKAKFRIDELLNKCAEKILSVEYPEVRWSSMSDLSKKPYLLKAVAFLEAMMDRAPLALTHSADGGGESLQSSVSD